MYGRRLVLLGGSAAQGETGAQVGKAASKKPGSLGVLSVHFEGGRCRVRCPFCYLGQRVGAIDAEAPQSDARDEKGRAATSLNLDLTLESVATLDYRELAVTLSEPIEPLLQPLERLMKAATARGKLTAVTTTLAVAMALPEAALAEVGRLNLSVDPWKGQVSAPAGHVDAQDIASVLSALGQKTKAERVLIVTLSTPRFAQELLDGLLAKLLELPEVSRLALNALKPPPPWCDRAFWLQALDRLRPLLRQHLDSRLFLDCYVAARILGMGACPARPDLSPGGEGQSAGVAFRSCVYQPAPDFVTHDVADLSSRLANFEVPAVCPFTIR